MSEPDSKVLITYLSSPSTINMQSRTALVGKVLAIFSAFYFVYAVISTDRSLDTQKYQKPAETVGSLHSPTTTILSWNPIIVYIRNFITEDERRYFLNLRCVSK